MEKTKEDEAMPSEPDVPQERIAENAPASRCAFYQAALLPASPSGSAENGPGSSGLQHRCLLNPGRLQGPDGKEIGLSACTLERQAQCQAQRRAMLARLCTSLPSLRAKSF